MYDNQYIYIPYVVDTIAFSYMPIAINLLKYYRWYKIWKEYILWSAHLYHQNIALSILSIFILPLYIIFNYKYKNNQLNLSTYQVLILSSTKVKCILLSITNFVLQVDMRYRSIRDDEININIQVTAFLIADVCMRYKIGCILSLPFRVT